MPSFEVNDMNYFQEISKISNAVLTPELNTCISCTLPYRVSKKAGRAYSHYNNQGPLSQDEKKFRKIWCKDQLALLVNNPSNAVLGDAV